MSEVTLRNGTVYKEPQAEKVEDSKCPESIWDKWEKEELKVEDSGSEADFGTKDKEESWEDFCNLCTCKCDFRGSIKTPAFQCCSYLDFIKSLLEAEKKKAVEEYGHKFIEDVIGISNLDGGKWGITHANMLKLKAKYAEDKDMSWKAGKGLKAKYKKGDK